MGASMASMAIDSVLALEFFWWFVFVSVLFGLCFALTFGLTLYDPKAKTVLPLLTFSQRVEIADNISSIPIYVMFCILATKATCELWGDVHSRWHGVTMASKHFQLLYVAKVLFHFPVNCIVLQGDPVFHLLMVAHHVTSIACFGSSLITTRMHFWATFDGLCEVTNIFLTSVFTLKWFSAQNSSTHIFANAFFSVGLWMTFLVFRLVLFPVWFYWMYVDISKHPAETWERVTMYELCFYPIVTLFLLMLSILWFVPITKGTLKALGFHDKVAEEKKA